MARRTVLILGSYGASIPAFRGDLVRALVESGCRVVVGAAFGSSAEVAAVADLGAEAREIPTDRHGMNPLSELSYAHRVRRLVEAVGPDVFLGYTAKPVVWGAPAAQAAGVGVVVALVTGLGFAFTGGGGVQRRVARAALGALYRRALARCTAVIFQNPDDRDDFARLGLCPAGLRTVVVGGSGIDLASFPPHPVPGRPAFLMIARLLGDKGVREYATAAVELAKRHRAVPFRLAGWREDGPDAISDAEIESWVKGGLEFVGRLHDVRPALSACSCYVLPSYREGTPRTVLEAMSIGRAIVTTDVPGCRQTVEAGSNGYLVPARDAAALAGAMERFVLEPGLAIRMGAASRRAAERSYDVRDVNRAMLSCMGFDG